ncbi:hypothetical protein ACIP8U_44840 [Streptomyces pseudovenezuelae]|uniref:hypothetical protein n=1 Tax=Streptomyces pseudovenezuelae TaxID=67350 RepID=UPI0036E36AF1
MSAKPDEAEPADVLADSHINTGATWRDLENLNVVRYEREHQAARARRLAIGVAVILALAGMNGPWLYRFSAEKYATYKKEKGAANAAPSDWTPLAWTFSVCLIALSVIGVLFLITYRQYMKNQNEGFDARLKAQADYHRRALEKLRKASELNTLMDLNQGQIGDYHRIVTDQADKAFKSSRTAMWVGLLLLVCAAVAGRYVPLEEIRWFIGALAAFSTLLSGYLSRTYMVLYRESISQLNRYFDQPVLNSYFLTAERLAAGLDAEHAQAVRQQIINEVLASSSRLGEKGREAVPALTGKRPKKRVPKRAAKSANGQVSLN